LISRVGNKFEIMWEKLKPSNSHHEFGSALRYSLMFDKMFCCFLATRQQQNYLNIDSTMTQSIPLSLWSCPCREVELSTLRSSYLSLLLLVGHVYVAVQWHILFHTWWVDLEDQQVTASMRLDSFVTKAVNHNYVAASLHRARRPVEAYPTPVRGHRHVHPTALVVVLLLAFT
jgi:hypothetical protein